MRDCPVTVRVVAWLLVVAGVFGLFAQMLAVVSHLSLGMVFAGVSLCVLAILAGIALLRRQGWARWLAMAWMAAHVVIGALHSTGSTLMHAVILVLFAYALFSPQAERWFAAPVSDPSTT